jgi:hypothetical protein
VVVNKVDRLGGDVSALGEVLAHVRHHLDGRCVGVFAVSATEALAARSREDGGLAELDACGWTALEAAVRTQFMERAGRLKALEAASATVDVLAQATQRTEETVAQLAEAKQRVDETRLRIQSRVARIDIDVLDALRVTMLRETNTLRSRVLEEARSLLSVGDGLIARRRLQATDAAFVLSRLPGYAGRVASSSLMPLRHYVASLQADAIEACEHAAQVAGRPESRTIQRRIEALLMQASLLEQLLEERAVISVERAVAERAALLQDRVLIEAAERLNASGDDAAALIDLIPQVDARWQNAVESWALEYAAAVERLLEQAGRDVELLAIDLEQRIIRPFALARAGLGQWNLDQTEGANDPTVEER